MKEQGPSRIDPARAAELYRSGLSCEQVGAVMGFSMGGVHNCLKRNGVELRNPGTRPISIGDEVLVRLLAEGLTGPAIAERLGMNVQTVYTRLRRYRGALTWQPADGHRR